LHYRRVLSAYAALLSTLERCYCLLSSPLRITVTIRTVLGGERDSLLG
jgi:hypothetical protein